ncbi:MAG: hypothetical protein IPI64_00035 [Chloracidobacterium sp.]|nr:hypothetical protein [Chloracidobacterium sp.]
MSLENYKTTASISEEPNPQTLVPSLLVEETFLCFCSYGSFTRVATYFDNNGIKVPLFVLLESYDSNKIDEVYQHPYLYTRGFFHESTLDPEEVGHIIRIVSSFRRQKEFHGIQAKKKIGWKIQRNNVGGTTADLMISLFFDPAMRDFMQRLLFVVESVNVDIPKAERRRRNTNRFREIFGRIEGFLENGPFEGRGDGAEIEKEARSILSKGKANEARPDSVGGRDGSRENSYR